MKIYLLGAANPETIRMIRDSVTVEPVLRATLIGELLPKIQTSLPYLKKPFEQSIQLLADANLDEIDWIYLLAAPFLAVGKNLNGLFQTPSEASLDIHLYL